eukprot:scaffold686035_cov67-Attheya_sp.AAC.2
MRTVVGLLLLGAARFDSGAAGATTSGLAMISCLNHEEFNVSLLSVSTDNRSKDAAINKGSFSISKLDL